MADDGRDGVAGHSGDEPRAQHRGPADPQALEDVLASIRALVSSEASARLGREGAEAPVLVLTPEMRIDLPEGGARDGEILAEGLGAFHPAGSPAPILDEEALRGVVNRIVREELQGELGDRISRNLRKLIRREMSQLLQDRKDDA
jgi:hypothetical protein